MRSLNDIHGATDDEISGYLEIVETKDFRQHVAEFSGQQRTLRDWFAGMALQGIMAAQEPESFCYDSPDDEHASWVAPTAFSIADAMLAARKEAR